MIQHSMNLGKSVVGYVSIVLLAYGSAISQDPNHKFEHITKADGLSSNIVRSILQDSKGFMWFGTAEGLNRYDGYTIKEYRYDPRDTSVITGIAEDGHGMLWLTSWGGGLLRRIALALFGLVRSAKDSIVLIVKQSSLPPLNTTLQIPTALAAIISMIL